MMRPLLVSLLLMVVGPTLMAEPSDVYSFDSRTEEQRFHNLISELRCPKCQNQNIADSNAPISKDMRDEVYQMMSAGASNEDIVGALVDRFGEFVRYKPEVDRRTILLWATPAIAVAVGFVVVAVIVIRSRRNGEGETALSEEERGRAARMLADDNSDRTS
ncbi:cytochrome c-type biogenesis protein CcmH [Marinobacter sp. TBZ242]|uniref:Cytochrome c-type biogenesis protein n=1 Tax=Marinobacter azerbaijanicus TaxID=3050455 RepID=A0ABT7I7B0_9GAMM|nr:cytochrome c-type biogenesis protein [Marinobacter sp. TBZ242]MDL0430036.1 cytochrome c-type biogenesis protein CcmH [Marinobacter sp. TBZ242]